MQITYFGLFFTKQVKLQIFALYLMVWANFSFSLSSFRFNFSDGGATVPKLFREDRLPEYILGSWALKCECDVIKRRF